MEISIHALVKRATYAKTLASAKSFNFNPRPRKEGDRLPKNDKKR